MNSETSKHVIPIAPRQQCTTPVPLRAIYVLAAPDAECAAPQVQVERLPVREAFVAMIGNTFNRYITDSDRLRRQFAETTRLVDTVPVSKLSYPRSFERLSEVRQAVLTDTALQSGRAM